MDIKIIIIGLILELLIVIPVYYIGFTFLIKGSKKETIGDDMIKRMDLMLNQENIIDKVEELVDNLIKKAANIYIILNFGPDKEKYIISTESEEMSLYIKAMVKKNITPEILSLIRLIRNINSEKDLDDYLNLKIKLYVIAIVVDKNAILE